MPKISVIMPARNAEQYIREAVDSILGQTFADFEFLILDDGSTDATAEIVQCCRDERIRFCPNGRNMGVAATLNRGLALAGGAYIARMDADDISLPKRFEKQAAYLNAHRDVAVLGSDLELFCDTGILERRVLSHEPDKLKEDLFFSCGIAHPSVMMRKDVILALGGYDPAYNGLEDYELWCRVAEKHKIAALPEVLFRYRVHGGQVTQNPSPQWMERMNNLKRRQISRLSLRAAPAEFEAYTAYCTSRLPKTAAAIAALGRFFEKAAAANAGARYYREDYLTADFQSVMLALAAALPPDAQRQLCAESSWLSLAMLRRARVKAVLKRRLGRK